MALMKLLLIIQLVLHKLLAAGGQHAGDLPAALQVNTMPLGSSWPASQLSYIASPASVFRFGWLEFPTGSGQFYAAVWYAALDQAIVWVANRDAPAAHTDTLQLTADGNLQLISSSSNGSGPSWQTGTSSKGVSSLQILDSGNVVLLLRNNNVSSGSSLYAWQSFSSPTDTLLPSQLLLSNQTLISRPPSYSTSLGSGNYKLHIAQGLASIGKIDAESGASIPTVWEAWQPVVFDVTLNHADSNNSSIAGEFQQNGLFSMYNASTGEAYSQLIPSDYVADPIKGNNYRRLTLDPDGNFRIYGWDSSAGKWLVRCEAIPSGSVCKNHVASCGAYGVCVEAPTPTCACPLGFYPQDVHDVSKGCIPIDNLPLPNCHNGSSNQVTYLTLRNTDFPSSDIYGSPHQKTTVPECQNMCSQQCTCIGFIYDETSASCWLKLALMNGYNPQMDSGSRDAYIKLWNFTASSSTPAAASSSLRQSPILAWMNSSTTFSASSPRSTNTSYDSFAPSSRKYSTRLLVSLVSLISLGEFLFFLLALFLLHKTNMCGLIRRHEGEASPLEHPGCRAFTYAELVQATENFRQPLGSGAFGEVFKGVLPDAREIAVKRLHASTSQAAGSHDQFKAEISTLGRIHHLNLVRLHGYCVEDSHRILVYDFMGNSSLDTFLFKQESAEGGDDSKEGEEGLVRGTKQGRLLDWATRYNICLGTARGLAYLHEECLNCIVHCDVKPENILLDKEFCPKVGDFGLAYLFGRDETVATSNIRGTRGYLAPEWLSMETITGKADVYSYGMVLIEIVSGCRNFRHTFERDVVMSPTWAFQQVQGGHVEEVLDPRIRMEANFEEVEKVLRIAFLCLHGDVRGRPSMKSIVQMLEGLVELPSLTQGSGSLHDLVMTDSDVVHLLNKMSTTSSTTSTFSSTNLIGTHTKVKPYHSTMSI